MQQRRDEILAKKAKLAELKRQRELRASQASAGRQSLGASSDVRDNGTACPLCKRLPAAFIVDIPNARSRRQSPRNRIPN